MYFKLGEFRLSLHVLVCMQPSNLRWPMILCMHSIKYYYYVMMIELFLTIFLLTVQLSVVYGYCGDAIHPNTTYTE